MPAPNVTVTQNNQEVQTTLTAAGVPTGILQTGGQVFGYSVPFPESQQLTSTQTANVIASGSATAALIPRTILAQKLIASYERQQLEDADFGPRLLTRTSLPIAANLPTISASATAPASDADAATQKIYPWDNLTNYAPEGTSTNSGLNFKLSSKFWYRGWNQLFDVHVPQVGVECSTGLGLVSMANTGTSYGSAPADSTLGYQMARAFNCIWEGELYGDVLFFPGLNNLFGFELYVEGSLASASTASTNITADGAGRGFVSTLATQPHWVKLKWSTVARRRITLVFTSQYKPTVFYTRVTGTLLPTIPTPITWFHLGDSFSVGTGASTPPIGLTNWFHSKFGLGYDYISSAVGGTSFGGPTAQNYPGNAPVASRNPSMRQNWILFGRPISPSIVTMLVGNNDIGSSGTGNAPSALSVSEFTATLLDITTNFPSALVFVCCSNASSQGGGGQPITADFTQVENAFATAAAAFPTVTVLRFMAPSQAYPVFLRGSGRVGATTGNGNADLYVCSTDYTHPSDAGHEAWGVQMARLMYEACKRIAP
jgi:lysophospholipase L1-like esterase